VPYIIKPQEKARPATPKFPKPNVARYALASNVFPKLTDAVSVGDRFHRGLIRRSANLDKNGEPDPVFLGKDKQNNPLQGHQHAWYLPEDADGDGKIDHVLVYAEKGFSPNAIAALSRLRKVWNRDGLNLQTVLISLGQVSDYRGDQTGTIRGNHLSPLVASGLVWESITPVVLQRHPKYDRQGNRKCRPDTGLQIDGPEDQVYRMLKQLGFAQPSKVQLLDSHKKLGGKYYCNQFQRHRYSGKGNKGPNRGYGFRITFKESQAGPLALGYGSHYGLGMFRPVE
jgi:CRISPR-associated protein Csb2